MTKEEKKIKAREYYKKWYDARKNNPEFKAKRAIVAHEQYIKHKKRHIAYCREYRKRDYVKDYYIRTSAKYYKNNKEDILKKQKERYDRLTDEQKKELADRQRRRRRRKSAVLRLDNAQKQLAAKAQSVADELNKLFEQWDR